jgi:hypothetical protein
MSNVEVEGHPTQDLIEELERRGAVRVAGAASGPNEETLRFALPQEDEAQGLWLFLPLQVFDTGFD